MKKRSYMRICLLWLASQIAISPSVAAQSTQEVGSQQTPLMDRQKEIALALSACPPSVANKAVRRYMTPNVQVIRLLTPVPMAYGAWNHDFRFIVLGLAILALAWCNGFIRQLFRSLIGRS